MEARLVCVALVAASLFSLGANSRTQNFIVTAATKELADEIAEQAEVFRRDLAVEWLGNELPPWGAPCPITVEEGPHLGAGGATSFSFHTGFPTEWTMNIQGSRERLLDSVLPHEVTHTIFASHFRCPLPRWADEGACTTVEHDSEKDRQKQFLIEFLTTNRGIAFNRMFAMKDYPPDVMPLYSQGYSLARYLIQQGGKRKFVDYIGEGMATNNWPATTKKFYKFRDLSQLQVTWLEWVRTGSPNLQDAAPPATALATTAATTASEPQVLFQSPDDQIQASGRKLVPVTPAIYDEGRNEEVVLSTYSDIESENGPPLEAAFPAEDSRVASVAQLDSSGRSYYATKRDAARSGGASPPTAPRRTAPYAPGSVASSRSQRHDRVHRVPMSERPMGTRLR
jgi:hypothetical protein